MRRLQFEGKLVQRDPGPCIHLRVRDRYGEFQSIRVHAVEALFDAHFWTMRAPRPVDPDFVIHAAGLHNERGIVLPFPDRISKPSWRRILREVSSISPDRAPDFAILV